MDLSTLVRQFIYSTENTELPENFDHFRILRPEYSPHAEERKPYPLPHGERFFSLLWDQHTAHSLAATILPRKKPFIYKAEFSPNSRTQMHSHEYLELFYIVEGEYRQKILGNEITFHKGELCLIDRNCRHQEILGSCAAVLFFGMTPAVFDSIMQKRVTTERISAFLDMALLEQKNTQQFLHFHPRADTGPQIEDTLSALLRELAQNDEASPIICQGLLLRVFRILSTQYEFSLSQKQKKEMNWILFEEISNFIKRNLANISLRLLSEEFHFQEDYFSRLLKLQTGMTYTEYLQTLRLQKAEQLLRTTDMRIDQIAHIVGYNNKGYFYKIFTELHQLTPAQFRKKVRG